MLKFNFYLDRQKSKLDKFGTYPIYLHFKLIDSINRERIFTRLRVSEKNWDVSKQRAKGNTPGITQLNIQLNEIVSRIQLLEIESFARKEEISRESIKASISGTKTNLKQSPMMFFQSQQLASVQKFRRSTLKAYTTTLNYLQGFANRKGLKWSDFVEGFDVAFIDYVKSNSKVSSDVTFGKHIKILKALLSRAYDKGYIKSKEFSKYKVHKADSLVPPLEEEELELLWNALPNLNKLDKEYLLGFLFLCETSMRFGEAKSLRWNDIHGDFVDVYDLKTDKQKRVFLNSRAKQVLEFHRQNGAKVPVIMKTAMNRRLKSIFTKLDLTRPAIVSKRKNLVTETDYRPFNEVICSKVGRRTYITLSINRGVSLAVIQRNTGHSDLRVLSSYVQVSDKMVLEALSQSR